MQQRGRMISLEDRLTLTADIALAHQDGLRATWHAYHLIGDVLRSPELAATSDGADFVTRFRERLQREPEPVRTGATALQPQEQVVVARPASRREAANAPGFGWPMVAGIASLAAVAAIAWSFIGSGGPVGGAELAQHPVAVRVAAHGADEARLDAEAAAGERRVEAEIGRASCRERVSSPV